MLTLFCFATYRLTLELSSEVVVVQEPSPVYSKVYLVGRSVFISTGQLGFYRYVFVYFLSMVVLFNLFLTDSHYVKWLMWQTLFSSDVLFGRRIIL